MARDKELLREKRRKKKRRKIRLVIFLIFLLVAALSALIIWQVYRVGEVKVEGNEHYSKEQIEKFVLDDKYSWNSLYVYLKYRFMEMEQIPFVDTMEISLENPKTLKIFVYEKEIIGYLYIASIDQNVYFDKDGFVVETSKEIIEGIPRVEGLNCDQVVLYEKLPIDDKDILRSLLGASQSLKKNGVVPEEIRFEENGSITLSYGNITVLLGGGDKLTNKILRLSYILPPLEGKKG
ncbi:MAG: FtsQ-type POTRA domain-containing protein, partial [Lachnospiraceae bacterium]|nr:FtsQ-type POTRA domain-containing protein [Lachnospiraceae bacterium]